MFSLFSCDRKEEKTDIDNQIDNLLSIMTIEEKIGQLCCPIGFDLYEKNTDSIYICNSLKEMIVNDNIGSLYAVMRACPWSKKPWKVVWIQKNLLYYLMRYSVTTWSTAD